MPRLQQAHYNDHRDDKQSGIMSKAQNSYWYGSDIDHELIQAFTPVVSRSGIERPRTRQEQIAFEAEAHAFKVRMGWA